MATVILCARREVLAVSPNTLVVDCGAHSTGAAVVVAGQMALVPDPGNGAALWPSQLAVEDGLCYAGSPAERIRLADPRNAVDAPRRALSSGLPIPLGDRDLTPVAALSAFFDAVHAAATRLVGTACDRLTLTVPTSYQAPDRHRELLLAAGEAAGFVEVELIGTAAAILHDAQPADSFPDGSLVLVCDLGETWSTALLQVQGDDAVVLASESCDAGRDLDDRLLHDLRAQTEDWLEPRLRLRGVEGLRAYHHATEFVRQIKHALTDLAEDAEVTGQLAAGAPRYTLTRQWLDRLAEPGARWAGASCRSLLARAAAGWAAGFYGSASAPSRTYTLADVPAVVLAGGHARLDAVARILREELGRPVIRSEGPDLAAVRGAARFAAAAGTRRIPAEHPRWRVEPISWEVPTGRARLERWLVGIGQSYRHGATVGQVRTVDERVYELAAPEDGVLLLRPDQVGDIVGPAIRAAVKRPASLLAGDPPDKWRELTGSGEWLFTPDRRALVECVPTGEAVRIWSFPEAQLVREFRPQFDGGSGPRRGRVFVAPDGGLALVSWDRAGAFSVWDVRTGTRTAAFRDATQPTKVLVNEREWRLSAEGEESASAGRYRRSVATVWDLATGNRLERFTDDWQRRLVGYEHRSVNDRLCDAAFSPDGRLRAVPVLGDGGPTGVSVRVATSEREVFRAEHEPTSRVRVAFSADSQFLLTSRESPKASRVVVWEL